MNCRRAWLFGRLGGGFEVGTEGFEVFGEHAGEADAVADLRVAGDDRGQDDEGSVELEFQFKASTEGEGKDGLDVATAQVEVGRVAADRGGSFFGIDFERDFELEAGGGAAFVVGLGHGFREGV